MPRGRPKSKSSAMSTRGARTKNVEGEAAASVSLYIIELITFHIREKKTKIPNFEFV